MSDAGRAKKKAHKVTVVSGTHGKGTPTGSRAGSPAPGASQAPSGMCLRAGPILRLPYRARVLYCTRC